MTAEEEIAKFWSLSSPVGQTTNAAKEQPPAKWPRKEGKGHKGAGRKRAQQTDDVQMAGDQGQLIHLMGRLLLRHEEEVQQLKMDRSHTIFSDTSGMSFLNQLLIASREWKAAKEASKVTYSLRTLLFGITISELLARLQKIEQDATALEKAVTAGWVLKDPLRWTFQVWNADKKANETDASKGAVAQAEITQGLQLLKQASAQDPFVHRFHTVKPMADKYATDTVLMLLTVTMKGQNSIKAHAVLTSLTNSSALRLIGMRLRPEHQQRSHLGQQLAQLL